MKPSKATNFSKRNLSRPTRSQQNPVQPGQPDYIADRFSGFRQFQTGSGDVDPHTCGYATAFPNPSYP